jgi:small subunit ribosomal protein S5
MVRNGEITTIHEALKTGLPLREPEIVDVLLPNLEDEVLDVNMVQRMTDSGRRVKFSITVVVGNRDGYVGIGQFKGKEVGPSIRKAINNAKLNIIEVKRGCGSWECGCGTTHTIPFQVLGKASSVEVVLKPAPRGVGLAMGDVAKHILRLAGFEDVWAFTRGQTRTTVNYAKAVFAALEKISTIRVREGQAMAFGIKEGSVEV